ncbi:unnamed protein product, partial [Laminaria digitata]
PLTPPSGQTPPPNLSWPAAGQTPAPNLSWPASTAQPSTNASEEPDVVLGEKLEDSALDIMVDASLLDALPEADEAPASAPEALADAAARQVEAAMANLGQDESEPTPPAAAEAPSSEDIDVQALKAAEPDLGDLSRTQIPLFSELPKNAFIELLVQMEMRELPAEQVIISEGEVGDSFFVLVSGSVRVQRRDDSGQDVVLAYLNEGAFFGEMALLQDGARTATVVAQAESQIFEISKEVLD